jgi:hypothetical protein
MPVSQEPSGGRESIVYRGGFAVLIPLVLTALALVLAFARPADAHFQTYPYTLNGCPADLSRTVDPVNMVFWNKADGGTTKNNIGYHTGWTNHSGSTQYFSSHSVCGEMYDQTANGCVACTRTHIRYKKTYDNDSTLGITSRGDAHHEDWVQTCHYGAGGHAVDANGSSGSGFDQGRKLVRAYFDGDPGHPWYSNYWGNTRNFKQCDGDYAGSDGYTVYIKLPHDH